MIQPGQKLKEDDYVSKFTLEQAIEILEIEHEKVGSYPHACLQEKLIVFQGDGLFCNVFDDSRLITEYSFPDFKQLCENTFGDDNR